jgi:hypothetical protein
MGKKGQQLSDFIGGIASVEARMRWKEGIGFDGRRPA